MPSISREVREEGEAPEKKPAAEQDDISFEEVLLLPLIPVTYGCLEVQASSRICMLWNVRTLRKKGVFLCCLADSLPHLAMASASRNAMSHVSRSEHSNGWKLQQPNRIRPCQLSTLLQAAKRTVKN